MGKITKIEEGEAYDSIWVEGVEKRAFHISKRSELPEIHIDTKDKKLQVIELPDEIVIVFGHRNLKKTRGELLFEK